MSKARLALGALVVLLLAACAGTGASAPQTLSRGGPAEAPAPMPPTAVGGSTEDAAKQSTLSSGVLGVRFQSDRVLILTAQLHLSAGDPWQISDRVQSLALSFGGEVIGVTQSGKGDQRSATVTVRVPNDRFNDALAQIKTLEGSELETAQVSGEDRTEQFIDLDARLKAKQQEEARYLALLARAEQIDDILKIDQVLSNVRTQIEQLQGQLNALKNRSAMATISVSVSSAAALPGVPDSGWQPARTFQAATAALLSTIRVFADAAIWAFVWLWVPLLGLGLVLALSRARARPTRAS